MKIISRTRYSPAASYLTNSASFLSVDATNLFVDFSTSFASQVLVRSVAQYGLIGSDKLIIGLRDASGAVVGSKRNILGAIGPSFAVSARALVAYEVYLTVNPNQNYKWFLAWALGSAADTGQIWNGADAGDESDVLMEVSTEE